MNSPAQPEVAISPTLTFTAPDSRLGHQVSELVRRCPPLDPNSTYCNLLQCHHFADTACAVLDDEHRLLGFVSGYLLPQQPDTLFIWQVAVDKTARGQALGQRMIRHILSRPVCHAVRYLETTVTEANQPSNAMFRKLADALDTRMDTSILFDHQKHFLGLHDSEVLLRIGPFTTTHPMNASDC